VPLTFSTWAVILIDFGGSFFRCLLWLNDTFDSKMFEEVNRKLHARNTMVQFVTFYTNPVHHNAQC